MDIPLPRLIARAGIGNNSISPQLIKEMGEKERCCFESPMEKPRCLELCGKIAEWTESALKGVATIMNTGSREVWQEQLTLLEQRKDIREAHAPPFEELVVKLGLNEAWGSILRGVGLLQTLTLVRAMRTPQGRG